MFSKCPRLGDLEITLKHSLIEIVALDENGNVKPDSYGSFQAANDDDAVRRVELAFLMFQSFKSQDRQMAAQEAFRALIGGYRVR